MQDRVYCVVYYLELTKDLITFLSHLIVSNDLGLSPTELFAMCHEVEYANEAVSLH